jgi:hypothetical protein
VFPMNSKEEHHKHCQDERQKPCSIIKVLA